MTKRPRETRPTRRGFLRTTSLLAPTLVVPTLVVPNMGALGRNPALAAGQDGSWSADLDSALLTLAGVVLPVTAIEQSGGADALRRVVADFEQWSRGFEPLAELDHPYLGSDEIRYGPVDPRPGWRSQLEGLELEAQKRYRTGFAEIGKERQRKILLRQLPSDVPTRLPYAASAAHVAIGLLAWFYSTSSANDLCYGRSIGRYECRGLPSARDLPSPLEQAREGRRSDGSPSGEGS